jgi:excisionase family DNA binding protein
MNVPARSLESPSRPSVRSRWLTVGEVAERLRCSARTVRRRITLGELTAFKFGGSVRVQESDLQAFIKNSRL